MKTLRNLLALTVLVCSSFAVTNQGVESGLAVGAGTPAFHPQHVAGPDKGTNACPP